MALPAAIAVAVPPPPLTATTSARRRRSSAASNGGERDDDSRAPNTPTSKKTLPLFLDSDETFHFFNDEMVLRTNAIRVVDEAEEIHDGGHGGRGHDGEAGEGDECDDEGFSDEFSEDDEEYYDDDDDDDDDEDPKSESEGDDENDEESVSASERGRAGADKDKRSRLRPSVSSSSLPKRNSLRSERIPDPASLYDEVYDAFDDLYVSSNAAVKESTVDGAPSSGSQLQELERKQRKRSRSARNAVATFVRRAHAAKSYRYRKQCEFLRVCYQRALETEPSCDEPSDAVVKDVATDSSTRQDGTPPLSSSSTTSSLLLGSTRRDDAIDMTVPTLHPRKWPHLPFRSPLQWKENVDDAVEFLFKLGELPESSLLYEPVDVQAFTSAVLALLKAAGVDVAGVDCDQELDVSRCRQALLPEEAIVGLTALLGMGIQLQSFSLLSFAALQMTLLGRGTPLTEKVMRPRLKSVLEMYWRRLVKGSTRTSFAATYSRGLVSQWKMSAYQPSSSDAIATDGLFLYIFGRTGLLKVGTGNGFTIRDYVYAHNRKYTRSRDAERSWLCSIGTQLYCRTILMPGNRVDRINAVDLDRVDELYFSPNRSVNVKGVSESSVYAMVTDGIDLYTIKCIDTLKRSVQGKETIRKPKGHPASTKEPLITRIIKQEQLKSDPPPASKSRIKSEESSIKVGDRVVRGPDWKWSNQDGTEGSLGTVERVSTWGGVAGSGVTVRWDKTQRVNTYRWGAEDCYDLVIVIEEAGQIVKRQELPSKQVERDAIPASEVVAEPLPRHQFVLYRHDVSRIVSTMDLEEEDIDLFLDLSPMEAESKESVVEQHAAEIEESALVSALHPHTLSLSESKSSWVCDGRLALCSGSNAAKRFRCDSGCDFDLCEYCVRSALIARESTTTEGGATDGGEAKKEAESEAGAEKKIDEPETVEGETGVLSADDTQPSDESEQRDSPNQASTESEEQSPEGASVNLENNPFAIFHASLFYDEEAGGTSKANDGSVRSAEEKSPSEQEKDLANELCAFWGGLYTRKECLVALRRNNFSLSDASVWIDDCAKDLRKSLLVPTTAEVTLTVKSGHGALDPVLLVAGSFYMSHGQLCIVSPPGLYSTGETQTEKPKRAVSSCDAAWFFSMETGKILSNEKESLPVLLRGVPAGSPTCVDSSSGHIFVYSGYLNCLEVYVDPARSIESSLVERPRDELSNLANLSEMGEHIFSQLHLLMLQRWSSPALKHPRAGLQELLLRTEREATQATSKPGATADVNSGAGQKSKTRRLRNIRGRMKMFEEIGQQDPPGYVIPFCVDFQDAGVFNLFRALIVHGERVCQDEHSASDHRSCRLANDILCLLRETSNEIDYAGIRMVGEPADAGAKKLCQGAEKVLLDLARGENIISHHSRGLHHDDQLLHSRLISTAQAVLSWGIRKGLFCRDKKSTVIAEIGARIVSLMEQEQSLLISQSALEFASDPPRVSHFSTEQDYEYGLLRGLLYCPTDAGRVDVAEFVPPNFGDFARLLSTLFRLSTLEFKSMILQSDSSSQHMNKITPVTKALHSLMNYCSVRLYNEKEETPECKAKLKESSRASSAELFNLFAVTCIGTCSELLQQFRNDPQSATMESSVLKTSVVGTILPLVMATISNYPAAVSAKARNNLVQLLKLLDKFAAEERSVGSMGSVVSNESYFEGDQVVESSHPYSQTQSSFRRVVRIPGATLLHIDFDPRSSTGGEADFVYITSGRSWFNSDRMAFAEGGIGDNGGCFFGSFSHGNWPTQGLSIVGDTVTVMLCATSQARDNPDRSEKTRWGLRCTVRGLFSHPTRSWLGDISCEVASACSVVTEQLMQSIPVQQVELQCRKWVKNCRELFQSASQHYPRESMDRTSSLREIVDSNTRGDVLKLLGQHARLHQSPNTSMNSNWTEALSCVAAVLIAQTDRVFFSALVKNLESSDPTQLADIETGQVRLIAIELQKVEQWMIRQVQLQNEWHYLQVDDVSVDDMRERYADNHDRLRELCELQHVVFHSADTAGCINKLHSLLQRQETQTKEDTRSQSTSSYHNVAREVVKKAQLLLNRYAKEKQQPGTSEHSRIKIGADSAKEISRSSEPQRSRLSVLGEFFRSSLPESAILECAQIQSRRLKDRISGFCLAESAFAGLESVDLSSWFVGRGLVALSSATGSESDYFSGCLLGDTALLVDLANVLRKCHAFNARLVNDVTAPLLLRSMAVADVFCSMQPEDDADILQGLDGTAKLVLSMDDAKTRLLSEDSIQFQTAQIVWILHRLIQRRGFCKMNPTSAPKQDTNHLLDMVAATRTLFEHYQSSGKLLLTEGASSNVSLKMTGRILRLVMTSLDVLAEHKAEAAWWIERSLNLLVQPGIPVSVSIAAARFCRKIIEVCGDQIFDLRVELQGLEGKVTLGRDLPRLLIAQVGSLASFLPTDASEDSDLKEPEQCCVLVFQSEEASLKMGDAIEKLGEPDITYLKMQLEKPESEEGKPQITESATANSSMMHRSVRCDGCDMSPLRGFRFKCFSCPNYDLCADCYTGQKHSLDHEFIRLSDSSSGMGDILQPRSKGGGTVPETSLVGSKHWKGSLLKVELAAKGYAVYQVGSSTECLAIAKGLADLGFLVTVVRSTELDAIDRAFCWESQLAATVEPGVARSGRRSTSAQKSTIQKADRSLINSMNNRLGSARGSTRARKMVDILALASEVIATVRILLGERDSFRRWRNSAFQSLGHAVGNACELLELPSLQGRDDHQRYHEAIGAVSVLGGFVEPLRTGGFVARRSSSTKVDSGKFGIISSYSEGNDTVHVCVSRTLTARSEKATNEVVVTTVSEIQPTPEIPVTADVIKSLEHLAPSFCALVKKLHDWLMTNKTGNNSLDCLHRSELGCVVMRSFSCMAPYWASLFDNQIISTHGNIPALLFHLAQLCLKDGGLNGVEKLCDIVWQTEWIRSEKLQYSLATRPIKRRSFSAADNADCVFRPPTSTDHSSGAEYSSEYFFNLYAYSSRSDIPQRSARNKLLEYWEKNVIPGIESYVSGSFKTYEMDYFFAQLREPLREGNSAAALKIAYTLCDGHVPSGCVYPDRDTDWSALQIDEVEVGGRYLISIDKLDSGGWPREMLWTVGHSGVVRLVNPSGMILLDVMNPTSSEVEHWWYHLDNLKPCPATMRSFSDQSVVDFEECGPKVLKLNKQLICTIARKSIFELLQVAPDHVMSLSIDRKNRRQESLLGNRYNLGELLRLAAAADLECPDKLIGLDGGYSDFTQCDTGENLSSSRGLSAVKHFHIEMLQLILNKHFDRASGEKAGAQRSTDEVLPLISKKQTKPVKTVGVSSSSLKPSSSQAKLSHQPDAEPPASPGKHRFMLMESLLRELKKCLNSFTSFVQKSSFTVASESPPKPVALVHVPGATCLILSFVVHPVLMDLPAGSSLEFFKDEQCTDRVFGYFGEKKGMNYLPPLIVPGDRCYVKTTQCIYARYKFRVDALTSDFGLSLWIGEELYQKLIMTSFTAYEVETLLSTLMSSFVEYLVTATCLPTSAKIPVFQLAAKLINFALGKGILSAVPIAKLSSSLVKELSVVYDNERTTQKGLYSLYTQQLAELISLIEEVSYLKGGSSPIVSGSWWTDYVRMAAFTRVLVQGKRDASTPDAFNRIYCGRAPIQEIEIAHRVLSSSDLYCGRLILVQKLPKTARVEDLRCSLSRYILHLSLEECGEADDQSVYSAAEVTRFGIFSKVLHLPVGDDGVTKGYAIIDVGREDIITNLLTRLPKEKFEFEGERTLEDSELVSRIASLGIKQTSAGASGPAANSDAHQDEQVWSCTVCTLENSITESECAACGSPIPPELASMNRELSTESEAVQPSAAEVESVNGWPCESCTFLNEWSDLNCVTCASERGADQVPPSPESESASTVAEGEDQVSSTDGAESASGLNVYHELMAVRFSDALQVAEEEEETGVPQVADFLRHVFVQVGSDGKEDFVDGFASVLRSEISQIGSSTESKNAVEAFTALVGMQSRCDQIDSEAFASEAITGGLDAVLTKPTAIYRWLRKSGYDLQFDLNHYPSIDAALYAQTKWTFQMDCQLIAMSKALSSSIGVLTLSELCPSHIRAKEHAQEYHLLAQLETRDLRLRFTVLKSLNRLLLEALPLVNLRPWSDPNSLRNRIVSIRQLIFPGVKIRFFAQTQDNTSLGCGINAPEGGSKRPMVTLDRRKIFGRRTLDLPLSLSDPKRSLFASTMKQLSGIKPPFLRAKRPMGASDPFVAFIVIFAGENVVGEGGPYRQLFNDISNELLSPGNPLFIPTQNNATKIGEYRERFVPKPSSTSKEQLQMFEFVGLLMGCCLRTGVRLNIRLAPIVWKMLVKQSLAFTDLENVDFSLCESLKYLETEATEGGLSSIDVLYESFTSTLSDGAVVELKANGRNIPVTKENCKEYIRLVKATRLQECKLQVDAMLRGMSKIVPVQLLQLCVWTELQQWICGSLDINVELLKRHTRYSSGMSPDKFPHLEMFWRVLSSFNEENKRRFINFAWGQDTLPADDAEFDRTHTRLLIKVPPVTEKSQDVLLPKADTCFFNIELPAYSSEAVMREKLLLAITLCTSLDGDDQTGHLDIYYAGDDGDDDGME